MGQKIKTALFLSAVMALVMFGMATANPITVDGNPADWLPAALLAQNTTNTGATVDPAVAVNSVYFTNDATKMYWRLETANPTDWAEAGIVAFCLSTESEVDAAYGPCISDYTLVLDNVLGTATLVDNSSSHSDTTQGIEVAVEGTTTEISILLSNVAITPANCASGCSIGASIHVDAALGGSTGEDFTNTSFTSAVEVGSGSPTSVTVMNFTARVSPLEEPTSSTVYWQIAALAVIVLFAILWKLVRYFKAA